MFCQADFLHPFFSRYFLLYGPRIRFIENQTPPQCFVIRFFRYLISYPLDSSLLFEIVLLSNHYSSFNFTEICRKRAPRDEKEPSLFSFPQNVNSDCSILCFLLIIFNTLLSYMYIHCVFQ